jgi:hypothetical protein
MYIRFVKSQNRRRLIFGICHHFVKFRSMWWHGFGDSGVCAGVGCALGQVFIVVIRYLGAFLYCRQVLVRRGSMFPVNYCDLTILARLCPTAQFLFCASILAPTFIVVTPSEYRRSYRSSYRAKDWDTEINIRLQCSEIICPRHGVVKSSLDRPSSAPDRPICLIRMISVNYRTDGLDVAFWGARGPDKGLVQHGPPLETLLLSGGIRIKVRFAVGPRTRSLCPTPFFHLLAS